MIGQHDRVGGRLGEERAHARPVVEPLDGGDVAGRPRQEEAAAGEDEHEQRGDERHTSQPRHHLPRLAREEHGNGDQEQQRHGARCDRAEQAELISDPAEYEAADRNHPVARGDVHDGKGGQADGDRADRADDAALDDDGDGQRNDDEQHQLGRAHVLGPFEQTTPEHSVDADQQRECGGDPAGNEQGRPAGTELALEPQLGADPGHEQNDEDGEGPGPHVGRRPVVVDELRDTPPDEPALDRLAILARRHGCRRLLPAEHLGG